LKGGHADVQKCKWFSKTKWRDLYGRAVPACYIPEIASESDTGNFDEYTDSPPGDNIKLTTEQAEMFEEFDKIGFCAQPPPRQDTEPAPESEPEGDSQPAAA
jgi:hypothetical protein